eukprot:TRINITY_DN68525_c0_g1_i1.p1 TRINITY_DN68525_c0_g1~~TRINITY_DN68525_c0_g1_i1.p1  ORF type:complete len:514 (+),score=80.91 TRINITY_DN68525_c0_g1_i1:101-1642(+)
MASFSALENAVQETLFQQFLGGSDPACRLGGSRAVGRGVKRDVEDMDWWRYKRDVALWYCEWLDVYYDRADHAFSQLDELSQTYEPVDMVELRERAGRMRLELPGDDAESKSMADGDEGTAVVRSNSDCIDAGGLCWEVGEEDVEPQWDPDGHGNFTHWAKDVGRMFLWQEQSGVLYEYLAGQEKISPSTLPVESIPRYAALWSAEGPVCVLSRQDDPRVSRVVDRRGVTLGASPLTTCADATSDGTEAVRWAVAGKGVLEQHAILMPSESGRWWLQPLPGESETLVDGKRLQVGRVARLQHRALVRLGEDVELRVELPDWHGAPSEESASSSSTKQGGQSSAAPPSSTFESPFVPAAAPDAAQPAQHMRGTERARQLNRALRRALGLRSTSTRERIDAASREARYVDQAAKRRRLHPTEWCDVHNTSEAALIAGQEHANEEASLSSLLSRQDRDGHTLEDGSFMGARDGSTGRAGIGYVPPAKSQQHGGDRAHRLALTRERYAAALDDAEQR